MTPNTDKPEPLGATMNSPFSHIWIEKKLRALKRFSGCSGIVYESDDYIYTSPKKLQKAIKNNADLTAFLESNISIKSFSIGNKKLVLIEPSPSLEDRTLEFLCEELEEDILFASTVDTIFQASVTISSNLNLKPLLHKVMSLSEEMLNSEVSAVMLLDPEKKELYWEISRGEKSEFFQKKITLPLGEGIAGHVVQTGKSILINDVHKDPRWCDSYDRKSGFHTRSMICVPMRYHGNILGVIEIINKKTGEFSSRDLLILEILASSTAAAIENAKIHDQLENAYEELKVLDKAKERVINHLSHELGTPLAIISGVLGRISKILQKADITELENTINRGRRNLNRLRELQDKINDILNQRSVGEKDKIINIIEDAASFVDELREENHEQYEEVLGLISKRIGTLYTTEDICMEKIQLDEFLNNMCDEAISSMKGRDLKIIRNFEKKIILNMDRNILNKTCSALLRNAIENVPDEGKIEITTKFGDNEIRIDFLDYGVGITPQNQKMIFGGFFHTQDTMLYSSKRPYDFNAGGSGSDLLRTEVFAERYGFSVDFDSTRCEFLPEDKDLCPGMISSCRFVKEKSECFSSGGSLFTIKFPLGKI